MNDFNDDRIYQLFSKTSTTVKLPRSTYKTDKDIELDDTAPLPLLIGIGLVLFLGFVILVLICCLCRRKNPSPSPDSQQHVNTANYQRAPMSDGGMAYPMTAVPPVAFHNAIPFNPHMGPTTQHNYGVIGAGMKFPSPAVNQFPQQPPHFGGVPTFPPNHYIPSLPLPPPSLVQQSHSLSHSSQASSSVSGATVDPLVPMSSSPAVMAHQQHVHPQQPFFPQIFHQNMAIHPQSAMQQHHQNMTIPSQSAMQQHHQHMQMMAGRELTGRESPAFQYTPVTYSAMLAGDHAGGQAQAPQLSTAGSPSVMTSSVTSSSPDGQQSNHQMDNQIAQSNTCTDEE